MEKKFTSEQVIEIVTKALEREPQKIVAMCNDIQLSQYLNVDEYLHNSLIHKIKERMKEIRNEGGTKELFIDSVWCERQRGAIVFCNYIDESDGFVSLDLRGELSDRTSRAVYLHDLGTETLKGILRYINSRIFYRSYRIEDNDVDDTYIVTFARDNEENTENYIQLPKVGFSIDHIKKLIDQEEMHYLINQSNKNGYRDAFAKIVKALKAKK